MPIKGLCLDNEIPSVVAGLEVGRTRRGATSAVVLDGAPAGAGVAARRVELTGPATTGPLAPMGVEAARGASFALSEMTPPAPDASTCGATATVFGTCAARISGIPGGLGPSFGPAITLLVTTGAEIPTTGPAAAAAVDVGG